MEILENELEVLISKLKNADDFRSEIENIQNVYPFNRYEYIITKLVEEKILSYDEYLELRTDYINRNLYLYVFEISAPRGFGDTWGFSHLLAVEPELKRPSKKIVYKFISDKIVCALNDGNLVLNSANIIISYDYPMEILVCLFNSHVYMFIYKKKLN